MVRIKTPKYFGSDYLCNIPFLSTHWWFLKHAHFISEVVNKSTKAYTWKSIFVWNRRMLLMKTLKRRGNEINPCDSAIGIIPNLPKWLLSFVHWDCHWRILDPKVAHLLMWGSIIFWINCVKYWEKQFILGLILAIEDILHFLVNF